MQDIINRLASAKSSDANLDTDIMIATGRWATREYQSFDYQKHKPANLTSSLDAALAFAEGTLSPDHRFAIFTNGAGKGPYAMAMRDNEPVRGDGYGATPAIALCLATLRAKVKP